MTIEYTYKITNTDVEAKTMEVLYSAEGMQQFLVGMPLPSEEESLEDIIQNYSPVIEWERTTKKVVSVPIGTQGTLSSDPEPVVVSLYEELDKELDTIINSLSINDKRSVNKVLGLNTNYLRVEPAINKKEMLVGVAFIVSPELTTQEGLLMFREAARVTKQARELGVRVIVRSSNLNSIDYLVNTLGLQKQTLSDGSVFMTTTEVTPTYAEKRALEYPSIGDQLDALYHAGVFPEGMQETIQNIKNKYPKV